VLPEQLARQNIDNQLQQYGWLVQNRHGMNIMAGTGVAVRELPPKTGFADYLLYVDGKAAGVIEAKSESHSLTGVQIRSAKYTSGLPTTALTIRWFRCWHPHRSQVVASERLMI